MRSRLYHWLPPFVRNPGVLLAPDLFLGNFKLLFVAEEGFLSKLGL
jgi:hypothetical protein